MRITFIIGLLAGLIGMLALSYAAPFLQQERVRALTTVQTNGGRLEQFEIHLDDDILMQAPGTASTAETIPGTADWFPELAPFEGLAAVYRLRNERNEVVGIASRIRGISAPEQVEWVLYLPARGLLALDGASVDTVELGDVVAGDREFANLIGEWQATIDENNVWRFKTLLRNRTVEQDVPANDGDVS